MYPCPTSGFAPLSQTNLHYVREGVCAECGKWVKATKELKPYKHRGRKKRK